MKEKLLIAYHAFLDKRTPWLVKAGLFLLIAYIISPIDLIPDFIPILGLLDEMILVPIFFSIFYVFIPEEVKHDVNNKKTRLVFNQSFRNTGVIIVITIWLSMILLTGYYLKMY